ncbi:MAG: hypothetical protein ACC651_01285 [Candidatus Scalindua sp.]
MTKMLMMLYFNSGLSVQSGLFISKTITLLFMSKNHYRLREYIPALLCISAILFNGCVFQKPKQPLKSDNTDIKEDKVKVDTPSVILEKEYLPEAPAKDREEADRVEGQKVLENIQKLETRLKAEEKERNKTSIQVKKHNNKKTPEEKHKDMLTNISKAETESKAVAAEPGSGYLSEGSAIRLGQVDGDDEIKVLKKVRRLEARLEAERNKVKALGEELTNLQAAKESVENDFANTKEELEEKSNNLLEKINALTSKLEETESRAIATEQELDPIKKELLKAQISETKAQQELYKLKIENLQKDEE